MSKFDSFAVLLLYFLLAATAFIMILIGIRQYKITADSMNENYEIRTAASYLTEKFRQNDTSLGIDITDLNGTSAIAMPEEIDGKTYITYIYYYDGYIRELYVSSDSVFDLSGGQEIIEAADLKVQKTSADIIEVTVTSTGNLTTTMYLSNHSS